MKHLITRKCLAAGLAALLLAGCAPGGPAASDSAAASGPAASPAPASPTPEPHTASAEMPLPAAGVSALTGRSGAAAGQRPVAVMVSNAAAAKPQWGIGSADLLIEANTGGESTSLMAVFDSYDKAVKVGPVTQGRDLFLQLVMPVNAVPMYIGADVYASNLVNYYTYQPLDGEYIGVNAFNLDRQRDAAAPQELCWYADSTLTQSALATYGQTTEGDTPTFFYFDEGYDAAQNAAGYRLEIGYGAERAVQLVFDGGMGQYVLWQGDSTQQDATREDGLAAFENVLLLMAPAGFKDDGVTRDYDLTGGDGLYLTGGSAVQIKWEKGEADQPLRLLDAEGGDFALRPGRTYLGVWGGFEGQSLRLLDAAGAEQPLPAAPAPMA